MQNLLLVTAGLLILTKLLDCLSTLAAIHAPRSETNPTARRWMERLGIRRTVWLVFGFASALVLVALALALASDLVLLQLAFVALGLPIAAVQLAVAHTNSTGRWNPVTRLVRALHARLR